jgi:hypothetical protein
MTDYTETARVGAIGANRNPLQPAISIDNGGPNRVTDGLDGRVDGATEPGSKLWTAGRDTDVSRVPDQEVKASNSALVGAGPAKTRRLQSQERVASWFARGDSLEPEVDLGAAEDAQLAGSGRDKACHLVPQF